VALGNTVNTTGSLTNLLQLRAKSRTRALIVLYLSDILHHSKDAALQEQPYHFSNNQE
jgi:hypothetical protein